MPKWLSLYLLFACCDDGKNDALAGSVLTFYFSLPLLLFSQDAIQNKKIISVELCRTNKIDLKISWQVG